MQKSTQQFSTHSLIHSPIDSAHCLVMCHFYPKKKQMIQTHDHQFELNQIKSYLKNIIPASHKPKILHSSWWLWQCTPPFSSTLHVEHIYRTHLYIHSLSQLDRFNPFSHDFIFSFQMYSLNFIEFDMCTHIYDVCVLSSEYTSFCPPRHTFMRHKNRLYLFVLHIHIHFW